MRPPLSDSVDEVGCLGYAAGFAGFLLVVMGGYGFYSLLSGGPGIWDRRRHLYWTIWESGALFALLLLAGAGLIWLANRLLPPWK